MLVEVRLTREHVLASGQPPIAPEGISATEAYWNFLEGIKPAGALPAPRPPPTCFSGHLAPPSRIAFFALLAPTVLSSFYAAALAAAGPRIR